MLYLNPGAPAVVVRGHLNPCAVVVIVDSALNPCAAVVVPYGCCDIRHRYGNGTDSGIVGRIATAGSGLAVVDNKRLVSGREIRGQIAEE